MPYVNIRLAGTLTREQKQQIATEITDTLERIAHKTQVLHLYRVLTSCRMKAGRLAANYSVTINNGVLCPCRMHISTVKHSF